MDDSNGRLLSSKQFTQQMLKRKWIKVDEQVNIREFKISVIVSVYIAMGATVAEW